MSAQVQPFGGPCGQCGHSPAARDASSAWRPLSSGRTLLGGRPRNVGHPIRDVSARSAASSNGVSPINGDSVWSKDAFPSYMQSGDERFCKEWQEALQAADKGPKKDKGHAIWEAMTREAERDAKSEPLLSSFLYASILAHDSFARALAFVLANRLANATMLPTQLFEIFLEVLSTDSEALDCALADVAAVVDRDPACSSYCSALLYFKGFQALQVHRIAHALWKRGQKVIAFTLQSRVSEVYAMDIHPAAQIGCGLLIDHGTGVVIGETAVVGQNVSILQNVTLGGTGKEVGDRHPKIHDNVLIGASATVLGNIVIGKGSQVAAGSLVLKNVPPHTMVAGSPATEVGRVSGNPALKMDQWSNKFDPFCDPPAEVVKEEKSDVEKSSSAVAVAEKKVVSVAEAENKVMTVAEKKDVIELTVVDDEADVQLHAMSEPEYFI